MIRAVFVDTSALAALLNSSDHHHKRAVDIFSNLAAGKASLIITNYIRLETHALLLQRAGSALATRFLEDQSFHIEWVREVDEQEAILIIKKYRDKNFTLTDATSFVVMKRLGLIEAVAFDRHFQQFGWTVLS